MGDLAASLAGSMSVSNMSRSFYASAKTTPASNGFSKSQTNFSTKNMQKNSKIFKDWYGTSSNVLLSNKRAVQNDIFSSFSKKT